jgi:uncharacterized protein (DUF1778 family)
MAYNRSLKAPNRMNIPVILLELLSNVGAWELAMTNKQMIEAIRGKKERLEARVSAEQKELFMRAAALQGSTLTEFVVRSLQEAASRTIREHEIMELTAQDREVVIETLLNPPRPNERLRQAAIEYRNIMGEE